MSGATPRYRRKTVLDPTLARQPFASNLAQVAAMDASEAGGCARVWMAAVGGLLCVDRPGQDGSRVAVSVWQVDATTNVGPHTQARLLPGQQGRFESFLIGMIRPE